MRPGAARGCPAHGFALAAVLTGALALTGSAQAAGSVLIAAPARVVFSINGGRILPDPGGGYAVRVAALPNGGAVVAAGVRCSVAGSQPASCPPEPGIGIARLTASGALDPSFATGGVGRVPAESPAVPVQVLSQVDGKLLLLATSLNTTGSPAQTRLVRLNHDGSLDRTFAASGVATLPFAAAANPSKTMAVAPNGDILITGAAGMPGTPDSFRWVIARLTPDGALDPTFGAGGLLTFGPMTGRGLALVVMPQGDIIALGRVEPPGKPLLPLPLMILTRLTPAGAASPAFNGGAPAVVPAGAIGSDLLVGPDGSISLDGGAALVRFTAAGAPDPAFANNGVALTSLPFQVGLLPGADGGLLAVGSQDDHRSSLEALAVAPNGAVEPGSAAGMQAILYEPAFGGGTASTPSSEDPAPNLRQNSFTLDQVARRPDGSLLLVGGVSVEQPASPLPPNGSGRGPTTVEVGVAVVTPQFTPDLRFGTAASPVPVKIGLAHQHLATARNRHAIRVTLSAGTPGLAQVTVMARGRLIAQSVVAILSSGVHTMQLALNAHADTTLLDTRSLRIRVRADVRDLAGRTASRSSTRTLR